MSKIIVDQVQKNGGDVLTLPSTDATSNNQPMVGATNGNLTFSPLALPAADGAANKPVTTDGSAQLQFGAFALPATAGTNGQFLTSNGTDAVWGSGAAGIAADISDDVIGTVVTGSARGNSYSTGSWTTSDGPNGTHYGQNAWDSSYHDETWNMFLGDGYPNGSSQIMYVNSHSGLPHRQMQFANNKRVGHSYRNHYYYQNQTSYGGFYIRVMPIRNNGSSPISVNMYAYASSYSNNHSGCSMVITRQQTVLVLLIQLLLVALGQLLPHTVAITLTTRLLAAAAFLFRQVRRYWLDCFRQPLTRQPMCSSTQTFSTTWIPPLVTAT